MQGLPVVGPAHAHDDIRAGVQAVERLGGALPAEREIAVGVDLNVAVRLRDSMPQAISLPVIHVVGGKNELVCGCTNRVQRLVRIAGLRRAVVGEDHAQS